MTHEKGHQTPDPGNSHESPAGGTRQSTSPPAARIGESRSVLQVLLQEQSQYREEVRMFDSHFTRVLSLYVTAIVAAIGWVAAAIARISEPRPSVSGTADVVTRSAAFGLGPLLEGDFFYIATVLPYLTALILLLAVRAWAGSYERFLLLERVSSRIRTIVQGEDPSEEILMLDRGIDHPGRRLRQGVESAAIAGWIALVLLGTAGVALATHSFAVTVPRTWWWWGAALGAPSLVILAAAISSIIITRTGYARLYSARRPGSVAPDTLRLIRESTTGRPNTVGTPAKF